MKGVPMSVSLTFDDPALSALKWEDLWSRSFAAGSSRGYLGAEIVTLFTKPFTPGEDATVAWAVAQDGLALVACYHMDDGQDLMLLERRYTKQSKEDAMIEQRAHIAKRLESLGISPASITLP